MAAILTDQGAVYLLDEAFSTQTFPVVLLRSYTMAGGLITAVTEMSGSGYAKQEIDPTSLAAAYYDVNGASSVAGVGIAGVKFTQDKAATDIAFTFSAASAYTCTAVAILKPGETVATTTNIIYIADLMGTGFQPNSAGDTLTITEILIHLSAGTVS